MKAATQCLPCVKRLVHQTVELATSDPKLRREARRMALGMLEREFSLDTVPAAISTRLQAELNEFLGNPDPYRAMKKRELKIARKLYSKLPKSYVRDLRARIELAAVGNVLDYFKDPSELARDVKRKPEFAVDDIEKFERSLGRATEVLYLADNTGECFFDLPLVKRLRKSAHVAYVVKGAPIQNDLTLGDLKASGIAREFGEVLTTGAAMVGLDAGRASGEFMLRFRAADLIVAKGMGYYETLSELPARGKVFCILQAKCEPVARSLGAKKGDFVASLR